MLTDDKDTDCQIKSEQTSSPVRVDGDSTESFPLKEELDGEEPIGSHALDGHECVSTSFTEPPEDMELPGEG